MKELKTSIKYKTIFGKYNEIEKQPSLQGRQKVFFICHTDDFDKWFDTISNDILAKQPNVAVCFVEPGSETDDTEIEAFLEGVTLAVAVISEKFIIDEKNENGARKQLDIVLKRKKLSNDISFLPIQIEPEIKELFNRKIGSYHLLNRNSKEDGVESYEVKLGKNLERVLIGKEEEERIKKEFAAQIFLSYRKKDRKHANELMKKIHAEEGENKNFTRDISIWYDENLEHGEDYNIEIKENIKDSLLFTLCVTPNITEGNNYVIREEYPYALESGITRFPVEMAETNREDLKDKFKKIEEATAIDDSNFRKKLENKILESPKGIKKKEDTPEHLYLIGLAYLTGFGVEKNSSRAIKLIMKAAEAGFPEAKQRLFWAYYLLADYTNALIWAKKAYEYNREKYGEKNTDTLTYRHFIADVLLKMGKSATESSEKKKTINDAIDIYKEIYVVRCECLGKDHLHTITTLNNIAAAYNELGDTDSALEQYQEIQDILKKSPDKYPVETRLTNDNQIASIYYKKDDYKQAIKTLEPAIEEAKVLGVESEWYNKLRRNLALYYIAFFSKPEDFQKPVDILEKVVIWAKTYYGENHPSTLRYSEDLAAAYRYNFELRKVKRTLTHIYEKYLEMYGLESEYTERVKKNIKDYEDNAEKYEMRYINTAHKKEVIKIWQRMEEEARHKYSRGGFPLVGVFENE